MAHWHIGQLLYWTLTYTQQLLYAAATKLLPTVWIYIDMNEGWVSIDIELIVYRHLMKRKG